MDPRATETLSMLNVQALIIMADLRELIAIYLYIWRHSPARETARTPIRRTLPRNKYYLEPIFSLNVHFSRFIIIACSAIVREHLN